MARREIIIERAGRNLIKHAGGITIKLELHHDAGWNDVLILGPYRAICFIETKRPDKDPEKLQAHKHRLLKKLGHKSYVAKTKEDFIEIYRQVVAEAKAAWEANQARSPRSSRQRAVAGRSKG